MSSKTIPSESETISTESLPIGQEKVDEVLTKVESEQTQVDEPGHEDGNCVDEEFDDGNDSEGFI